MIKQLIHTKIVYRRSEKYGCQVTSQVGINIEVIAGALYQLDFVTQLIRLVTQQLVQLWIIDPLDDIYFLPLLIPASLVQMYRVLEQMINTF